MEKKIGLGKSILTTFCGCPDIPDTAEEFERILREACTISGCRVRKIDSFVSDEFPPPEGYTTSGVTCAAILEESHAVTDSWPEYDALTFDIFTCGEKADPMKAVEFLKKALQPRKILYVKGETCEEPSVMERTAIVYSD